MYVFNCKCEFIYRFGQHLNKPRALTVDQQHCIPVVKSQVQMFLYIFSLNRKILSLFHVYEQLHFSHFQISLDMDNKLVIIISHSDRSEILTTIHAINLNLTVTGGLPHKLPSQTIHHLPKSVVIDIPANIMQEINDYKNKLHCRHDRKVIESDDKQIMEDDDKQIMEDDDERSDSEASQSSNVRATNDPNVLFKISATITHMLNENDVKYQTAQRASITENSWFGLHNITLCNPTPNAGKKAESKIFPPT
ncbi:unnamed protein product [Rotaria socialis]|uniref:Uncharacterized protein n=1 Tax=Rotaria socialis TaxID=392032 RepID=A0A818JVQ6_9BILA|nr:unnamed protein product [Rotaria socialis]CAF4895338.1 unnamed protein product [Rotaria socialis]